MMPEGRYLSEVNKKEHSSSEDCDDENWVANFLGDLEEGTKTSPTEVLCSNIAEEDNVETASDILKTAQEMFPAYDFGAVLPSDVGVDDEEDPVWSNDAEKAYFDYILEQERERRAKRGKSDQDSLIGPSTFGELLGLGEPFDGGNSTLDDDLGGYSLATTEQRSRSYGEEASENLKNAQARVFRRTFEEYSQNNEHEQDTLGSLPRVVYLGLDDDEEKGRSTKKPKTTSQHKRYGGRTISIFVAGISFLLLIIAAVLLIVAFFLKSKSSYSDQSVNEANATPSLISEQPSPAPTFLMKKTRPPNDKIPDYGTMVLLETETTLQSFSLAPTSTSAFPSTRPGLLPKKTPPPNNLQPDHDVTDFPSFKPSQMPSMHPSITFSAPPTSIEPLNHSPTVDVVELAVAAPLPTYYPVPHRTFTPTPGSTTTTMSSMKLILGLCQGDCDSSEDCINDLVCFQRERGDPPPVDCPHIDTSTQIDYCVKPAVGNT